MSYRLIDANALAANCKQVNDMPCIYADLPNGLDDGYYDLARAEQTCECVAEYAKSPIDGKTIVLHRCSACHELMRPHMAYCPNCGAKVVGG